VQNAMCKVPRAQTAPLYMRVMGASWSQVAEPIQCAHRTQTVRRAHGHLRIEHGRNRLARVIARLLRLPRCSAAAETRLTVTARAGGERWERAVNGRRFDTRQYESDRSELAERFGVLEFRYRLVTAAGSLLYTQREAAFVFGFVRLRIPPRCAPLVEAREDPAGPNRLTVNVRVVLPGVGPLITYGGLMSFEDTDP
jgi:Domain of unknown function (DUF4166)